METLITVLVVAIVMAAAFPVLPVFFRESNIVQNTYQSVDQLVLASEVATRYIHEAVAPSPTDNPVQIANANSATFYANTGDNAGPEQVVMQVATSGTARTFQANLYEASAGSCPGINVNGTQCTYTGSTESYLLINYLTNGTGGSPVFTYTLQGGEVCAGPPPGSPTTTLSQAATTGTTTLRVAALPTPVTQGDTIFLGSGPNAQTVTATAGAAKGSHDGGGDCAGRPRCAELLCLRFRGDDGAQHRAHDPQFGCVAPCHHAAGRCPEERGGRR